MCTINGMEWEKVVEKLRQRLPEEKMEDYGQKTKRNTSMPYFGIDVMEEHFQSIIPLKNYQKRYEDLQISSVQKKVRTKTEDIDISLSIISIKCILQLIDDNGEVIYEAQSYGSASINITDNGSIMDSSSVIPSAQSNAFKQCLKLLGVGVEQIKEKKAAKNSSPKNSSTGNNGKNQEELLTVLPVSKISISDKMAYMEIKILETGEQNTLVFWNDRIQECKHKVNSNGLTLWDYMRNWSEGSSIKFKIKGKRGTYKGQERISFLEYVSEEI